MVDPMTADVINQLEKNIAQAKEFVALGDALERLKNNRDFKAVMSEGYFKKEAIRLVLLKADVRMQSPAIQASIISQIDSIGNVNQYFEMVFRQADTGVKGIAADEETLQEVLAEGNAND